MNRGARSLSCALFLLFTACHGDDDAARTPAEDGGLPDTGNRAPTADAAQDDAAREADAGPGTDAGVQEDAGVDPSAALFRPDHVLEVRLTLAPADWEALRNQRPAAGPRANCSGEPTAESYSQFHADLEVDGVALTNVAVRKKGGLGSISSTRPGLKVDVHEYVADQDLYGLEHLTLNNNHQDPSLISQCLGYGLFHAAGVPASRCSFAHVVVNGEDLGVYSNVETLKREFLRRNFADATGELFESGGDFQPNRDDDFEPKSDTAPPDCSALSAVTAALGASDATLAAELGAVLDLTEFNRYWAMEVITNHWDGYANNQNNFYVYAEPSSGRLKFVPWGIDALFTERARSTRPDSVFACGALSWRLYDAPATRKMYLDTLRELLQSVWDVPSILAEIDRMEALIKPFADPAGTGELADEITKTRQFVSTRAATLLGELDAGDPVWPYAADESCRIRVGSLTASFEGTWDSLDQFDVGNGTMGGDVSGVSLASSSIYAGAGLGDDGKPVVRLLNPLPDGRYAGVYIVVQDDAYFTPGTFPLDLSNVAAALTFYDPATDTSSGGGLLYPGSLTLESASTSPGGAVRGQLTGDVLEL